MVVPSVSLKHLIFLIFRLSSGEGSCGSEKGRVANELLISNSYAKLGLSHNVTVMIYAKLV